MTPDEATEAMRAIAASVDADEQDTEAAHVRADQLLCDVLSGLGYEGLVQAFQALPRWYS